MERMNAFIKMDVLILNKMESSGHVFKYISNDPSIANELSNSMKQSPS
jgi:hypothetical protein